MAFKIIFLTFLAGANFLSGQTAWNPHEGGLLKYRVKIRFGQEPSTMPVGWTFGRVSAVAANLKGEVFVFHRGAEADPIVVLNSDGEYLRSWGRGVFGNEHGLRVDQDGNVWVTDNGDHQVIKFDPNGKVLLKLGIRGQPGADEKTFNRPTDIAFTPAGDFYVSDGYGNSRVIRFSRDGEFITSWGSKGTSPGEFNTPHSIALDSNGRVYVSDRENNRIQIFTGDGVFVEQWTHLGATQGIFMTSDDELWIITHRNNIENLTYDTLAGRIMKIDIETGKVLGSMESPGHWIHVTPGKEIYIGSLTGNVFFWYQGWLEHGLGAEEGLKAPG